MDGIVAYVPDSFLTVATVGTFVAAVAVATLILIAPAR
jgi:hypothetical protein